VMETVYLVLSREYDTPSRDVGGAQISSAVFATPQHAQMSVQINHDNMRRRRGLPPEALVWDGLIPKHPTGHWLEGVVVRTEPVWTEDMIATANQP